MGAPSSWRIVTNNEERFVLEDVGDYSYQLTITNNVEDVLSQLRHMIKDKRFFYYDSDGELTEVLHKDGKFLGFKE